MAFKIYLIVKIKQLLETFTEKNQLLMNMSLKYNNDTFYFRMYNLYILIE